MRRAVGIFRVDGKTSLRALQDCIRKILCVDLSLGFIYKAHESISNSGKNQLKGIFPGKSFSTFVMDEVWIKVTKTKEAWNFDFLAASPKSLFISFFDYVAKRDEPSMGIKVSEHKERGFNPSILTTDFLSTYRAIVGYFSACLHGFSHKSCKAHYREES